VKTIKIVKIAPTIQDVLGVKLQKHVSMIQAKKLLSVEISKLKLAETLVSIFLVIVQTV